MLKRPLLALLLLAACGDGPGPSVAMQPGMTLSTANAAIRACAPDAPAGGKRAVFGSYASGVILGGLIVGPLIVAGNEDLIRAQGEAAAVDTCLAKRGFQRRDLTPAEFNALNGRSPTERQRLLDHLIVGGTLDTYSAT